MEDFAIARAQPLKPHHVLQRFAAISLNGMTCALLSDRTMVDFGRTAMPETVDTLARKIDRRFDAVDEHFAEQRAYIEFAYERLDQKMSAGFAEVKADLAGVKADLGGVKADLAGVKTDLGGVKADLAGVKTELAGVKTDLGGVKADLAGVKTELAGVKTDLGGVKADLAGIKTELAGVKTELAGVKADLRGLTSRFDRLERKLDQLIDRHAP
jgi:archaellum component FlaC